MKKILQIIPYSYHLHTGGVEKIAQTLGDGLTSLGDFEVKNFASAIGQQNTDTPASDTIYWPGKELVNNFPIPQFWKKQFWQQLRTLHAWKPDIILTHTRFFLSSFLGGLCAKAWGCRWIHVEHGSGFVTGYPRYIRYSAWLFDRTMGLWIFRQCDQLVTISFAHKKFLSKFTAKDPVVIYNPVDYQPQPKIKNEIPHIGFVGRLVPLKGVNLLIDALAELLQVAWTCTIVGDGPERKKLEEQSHRLGLSDRIQFVGADDRANRLHKFDIFVNPSYQEGVPTTVIEALMAGCVVVATDVGGTREISEQDDLIVVGNGNTEKLKNGISRAIFSHCMTGVSYDYVLYQFSIESALKKYVTLFI